MWLFLRTMVIRSTIKEPTEPPKTSDSERKHTSITEDNITQTTTSGSESKVGGSPSDSRVTSKVEPKPLESQAVDKPIVENTPEASTKSTDPNEKKPEVETSNNTPDGEEDMDHPLQWMVRTCNFYYEEYRECKRWKGRFHQWFVDGAFEDCSPHKEQYKNCNLWKSKGDLKALEQIIAYERGKIRHRIRNHIANDVWENREKAPEDWNKPLPPDIAQEYENSYLKTKQADFEKDSRREHIYDDQTLYADDSTCAIV